MQKETSIHFNCFEDLKTKIEQDLKEQYKKETKLHYYAGYGNILRGTLGKDLVEIHLSYNFKQKINSSYSLIFL